MNKSVIISLALVSGIALCAQSTVDFRAKAGLVSAQGDLLSLTNRHQGRFFEAGANLSIKDPDLGLYFHVGHLVVQRDELDAGNFADAKNSWLGLDLQYPVTSKFGLFTGPTMNLWSVTALTGSYPDSSWKMGWRVGGRYTVAKNWSVEAVYSLSEWTQLQRKNRNGTLRPPENLAPSWFTIGAVYSF
jgi:hypothetical protein